MHAVRALQTFAGEVATSDKKENMKLYVGNMSFQTTEQDLRELFGQFGTVTDAVVMMDRDTQRPRGFGFVTMSSSEEGQKAIESLHGQNHDGRDLTVNEARPMEARGPRREFSGGKGGGGGGGNRNRY
jgi:cold-inducible RNA-binding protein